jgi:hypothetical protein
MKEILLFFEGPLSTVAYSAFCSVGAGDTFLRDKATRA